MVFSTDNYMSIIINLTGNAGHVIGWWWWGIWR